MNYCDVMSTNANKKNIVPHVVFEALGARRVISVQETLLGHVHSSEEPQVVDGELDTQPDGLDHGLNPLEPPNHATYTMSRRR